MAKLLINALNPIEQEEPLWIRVHRTLEQEITERVLPPGRKIVEADIARRLGVSRIPVREAIRMLERDGWITAEPRVGRSVRVMSDEEIRQLFEMRELVDGNAAASAAKLIRHKDTADLRDILADEAKARVDHDRRRIIDLNFGFHCAIASLSDNIFLERFTELFSNYTKWVQGAFAGSVEAPTLKDHIEILQAIEDGNASKARSAARRHVRSAHKSYLASLNTMLSEPH